MAPMGTEWGGKRAAISALLFLPLLALFPAQSLAQGYWVVYPDQCAGTCAPSQTNLANNNACISACNNCLLNSGCYSSFLPGFVVAVGQNSFVLSASLCACYWPWWAWFLLAVGLALILFVCTPLIFIYCCKRMNKGKEDPAAAQQHAATYAGQQEQRQ